VVRILWIIFGLLPVIPGTVLYLVLWIIVPAADD
jgi:phage shock protein PspC (stress-responsive transcriptional regulator)